MVDVARGAGVGKIELSDIDRLTGFSGRPSRPREGALPAALRDELRFTAIWIGLAAAFGGATVMAFGPFHEATQLRALLAELPRPVSSFFGIAHLSSWSRFVDAVLFGFLAPIAFLSFSIGVGTRSGVAQGSMPADVTATVVARVRRGFAAVGAPGLRLMAAGNVLLGLALAAGVWVAAAAIRATVAIGPLISAVTADAALGVTFGLFGFLFAARFGRAGLAALLATLLAVVAGTFNGIAPAVPAFGDIRYLSLVYYAESGTPLLRGQSSTHLEVLIAAVLAAAVLVAWDLGRCVRHPHK